MSATDTDNEEVIVIESQNAQSVRESRLQKRQQKAFSLVQDEDSHDAALREAGIDTSGMSKAEKQQLAKILQMSKTDTSQIQNVDRETESTKTCDESSSSIPHKDVMEDALSKPPPLEEIDYGEWISAQTRITPEDSKGREEENKPKLLVKPLVKKAGRQTPKRVAPTQHEKSKGERDERPLKQRKIDQFSHIIILEESPSPESQDCKQMDFDDKQHIPSNTHVDDDDTQPPNSPDIFQSQPVEDEDKQGGDSRQREVDEEATQDYDVTDKEENNNADESVKPGKPYGQGKKNFLSFSKIRSIKDSMIRAVRSKFSQAHEEEGQTEEGNEVESYEEVKPLYRHYRKLRRKYKTRQTYYAPAGIDTNDYTKVILQLFEIYHRKLAEAQARVDTFVNWGEGVKVGRHMSDSIGVWRKRNAYVDDFSGDEADSMTVKPNTAVNKKTISDDEDHVQNMDTSRRLRNRETTATSVKQKDIFDFETQPFYQDDAVMEIENDDTTTQLRSENIPPSSEQKNPDQQLTCMTDQGSDHMAQKGGKTGTQTKEGQKGKKLYSESFEKFFPIDNSLYGRRWSDIMDENSNDELLSLQNVKVDYSRKRRPIRLTKKREKILTKKVKKSTLDKHGSDSSIESIPSDKEGCDIEISELTRNQSPNFSQDLQDQSDAQRKQSPSPENLSRSTDNTGAGSCSGSPVNRPSSQASNVSKENLSQGSGYILNPQGEIYSTQACVRLEKMQTSAEKKISKSRLKKKNGISSKSGKEQSEKSLRILRSKTVTDVVTGLENSEGESSGRRTASSGFPSEDNESSRDSTGITFNLMQPTLVDDDIECFETKPHLDHSRTTSQKDSPERETRISDSQEKTDSQSPDFKKSKIIKKHLEIVASNSEDEIEFNFKTEHAQPEGELSKHSPARVKSLSVDFEDLSSDKQYLMPGPSWFQPRGKNWQSPAFESSQDGGGDRLLIPPEGENVDMDRNVMKDHPILRKSPRHRSTEKEVEREKSRFRGKNRGSRNLTRSERGRGQISKLGEKQVKNLQNTGSDEEKRVRGQTRKLGETRGKSPQNTSGDEEERRRGQTRKLRETRGKSPQNTSIDEEANWLDKENTKQKEISQSDHDDDIESEALLAEKIVDNISKKYNKRMSDGDMADAKSSMQETNVPWQSDDVDGEKRIRGKKRNETLIQEESSVVDLSITVSDDENQKLQTPGVENRQRTRKRGRPIKQAGIAEGTIGHSEGEETKTINRGQKKRMQEEDHDVESVSKSQKVETMPCPLCNREFPMDQIQEHAAECDGEVPDDDEGTATDPSMIHNSLDASTPPVRPSEGFHSSQPRSQSSHDSSGGSQAATNPFYVEMNTCYICDEEFPKGKEYDKHIDECLEEAKKRQQEADMKKYRIPRLQEEPRTTRSKVKDDKKFEGLEGTWADAPSDGYSSENEEESQTLKNIIQNGHKYTKRKTLDSSQSSTESDSSYTSKEEHSQSNEVLPGGWTLEELKNSPMKTYVPISAQSESEGFRNQYSKAKARYERQLLRQGNASGKIKKKGRKRKRSTKGKKKTVSKKRKT